MPLTLLIPLLNALPGLINAIGTEIDRREARRQAAELARADPRTLRRQLLAYAASSRAGHGLR